MTYEVEHDNFSSMEIYHVLSRGVDKRTIFKDRHDYLRFICDLVEFNDNNPAENIHRIPYKVFDFVSQTKPDTKVKLVNIHAFSLMHNHYHLMLSPAVEGGITKFMRKLNIGYAKYFNQKNQRAGALFEGRYKSILISDPVHFLHLPNYIHLNPLDIYAPEWRRGKIKNYQQAIGHLKKYKWSSLLDYIGVPNFPMVISKDLILEVFGSTEYEKQLFGWLKEMNLEYIDDIILE